MKMHVFGASGSGTTTLGKYLSEKLNCPYFDSDDYYWEASTPPFTHRRNPDERNARLANALAPHPDWILGGSIVGWKDWLPAFDLAVFLWLPSNVRTDRLEKREYERYGEVIRSDPERRRQYEEFIEWAAGYDDNTARGRTLAVHENWLGNLPCPVPELRGDLSVERRAEIVLERMEKIG
ncbi:MAG: AAA family ATPase [Ferruginibacter sp.]|nr:AAA family ATPase [Cytophagales bacterium]